jgi:hypothetical protein
MSLTGHERLISDVDPRSAFLGSGRADLDFCVQSFDLSDGPMKSTQTQ